ncbi:MAG TPA: hypothetical protein VNE62_06650 [Actinomycetota bacterium]|nr:hypothetical protein [Actinomycetota bacterium]
MTEEQPVVGEPGAVRYRCSLCGNLTRFDVVESRRTRSFYHFTIGGLLRVESEEVLDRTVEEVLCRWCGTSSGVEQVAALESEA